MAQTTFLTMTKDWQLVATGPCTVTCTADAPDARYALREDEGLPPADLAGHRFPLREDRSMNLEAGTQLYARGRPGQLAVSVDPV